MNTTSLGQLNATRKAENRPSTTDPSSSRVRTGFECRHRHGRDGGGGEGGKLGKKGGERERERAREGSEGEREGEK